MKKIRTYGKHKQREVRVNLYDCWDDISDDDKAGMKCTTFLYDQASKWSKLPKNIGLTKPANIERNDTFSPSLEKIPKPVLNPSKTGYVASTPYAQKNTKRLQGLEGISCVQKSLQDSRNRPNNKIAEKNTNDEIVESSLARIVDLSSIHNYESPILFSNSFPAHSEVSEVHGIDVKPSKDTQHCSDIPVSVSSIAKKPTSRSINFDTHYSKNQMSLLEALTPFRHGDECSIDVFESRVFDESIELSGKERVLNLCQQERVLDICEYLSTSMLKSIHKIGEGLYGEVFQAENENGENIAIKIVPVNGELIVNGEKQKTFLEIIPEIATTRELSALQREDENGNQTCGFISVYRTVCCQGAYPKELVMEWEKWNEDGRSENDNPESFDEEQIFVMFETEFAGQALEDYSVRSAAEAKSILHQISAALAVGERALQFEHRDLHWGNVLIGKTAKQLDTCKIEGCSMDLPTSGLKISVIDFTLSRMEKDGCVVYCNLADDPTMFDGEGDYQFQIYRNMREENGNSWDKFCPKTNVLWLHYLTEKLIKIKLKRRSKKLEYFCKRICSYESACELLQDEYFYC